MRSTHTVDDVQPNFFHSYPNRADATLPSTARMMAEGSLLLQVALAVVLATISNSVLAVSFGLFYRIEKFFNFAHAGVFAIVAYIGAIALRNGVYPALVLVICLISAIGADAVASIVIRWGYRSKETSGLLGLMLSYSVYLCIQGFLTIVDVEFSAAFRVVSRPTIFEIYGASVADYQIIEICVGSTILTAAAHIISRTLAGWRAIAAMDDRILYEALGHDALSTIRISRAVASSFLGAGAYFAAAGSVIHPEMGFVALQAGIIIWILGIGTIKTILLSALVLSLLQNFAVWVGPANHSSAIVFGALALMAVAKRLLSYTSYGRRWIS